MKKKILVISLVVSLIAVGALGATLAYFTDTAAATNTFTMGNVDITLREPAWDGFDFEDAEIGQLPETPVAGTETLGYYEAKPLLPGDVAAKNPQVKNTGDNAAYVQMKVTISNYSGFEAMVQKYTELYPSGTLKIIPDLIKGLNTSEWTIVSGAGVVDSGANTITYTFQRNAVLAKGETTAALFTAIAIPDVLGQDVLSFIDDGFTITVTAQAIQAENFASPAAAFTALNNA